LGELLDASKFADHAVAFGQHIQLAVVVLGQTNVQPDFERL